MNGYYVEMVLFTLIGLIWYDIFKNVLKDLQSTNASQWLVQNVKQPAVREKSEHEFTDTGP